MGLFGWISIGFGVVALTILTLGTLIKRKPQPQAQPQAQPPQQDPVVDPSLGRWVKAAWVVVGITLALSLMGAIFLAKGTVNLKTILATVALVGVVLYLASGVGRIPNDYQQVVLVWGLRWTIWGHGIRVVLRGVMDAPEQYVFSVRHISMEAMRTKFQVEISNTTVDVSADVTVRSTDIPRTLFSVASDGGGTPGHRIITEKLAPAVIRSAIQTHFSTLQLAQVRAMRQRDLLGVVEPLAHDPLAQWGLVLSTCVVNVDERAATQQARDAQFMLNQTFEAVLTIARRLAGVDATTVLVRDTDEFRAVQDAFPEALRLFVTERAFGSNNQVLQLLSEHTFAALLGERSAGRQQQQQTPQTPPRQPQQQRGQGRGGRRRHP